MLAENVPIARTGSMVYGPNDIPIQPGLDGIIIVHRDEEEVFSPQTLGSIVGKPIVDGHPSEDVTPDNFDRYAKGVVLSAKRGDGVWSDCIVSDLMIWDKAMIAEIRDHGIRELSMGYDAEYIEMGELGKARQKNIRGNHLALVEAGRCGPRCAIGDHQTVKTEDSAMTLRERLAKLWADKDERGFTAALGEINEGPVTLTSAQIDTIVAKVRDSKEEHEKDCDCAKCKDGKTMDAVAADVKRIGDKVTSIDNRVKKMEDEDAEEKKKEEEERKKTEDNKEIEGELEEEAPPGTGDKAKKARDSAYLSDSWQETVSLAEILAPGIHVPTFDEKSLPKKTYDAMCQFRRTALDLASAKPEMRAFIDAVRGGKELKACTCDSIRSIFKAAGNHARNLNNLSVRSNNNSSTTTASAGIRTNRDMNKANREFWDKQPQ